MNTRTFRVGDRVVARAETDWDTDRPIPGDHPEYLLAGHYGHVVGQCDDTSDNHPCGNLVHVQWEGSIHRRGDTIYASDKPWHMYSEEIEHCD